MHTHRSTHTALAAFHTHQTASTLPTEGYTKRTLTYLPRNDACSAAYASAVIATVHMHCQPKAAVSDDSEPVALVMARSNSMNMATTDNT